MNILKLTKMEKRELDIIEDDEFTTYCIIQIFDKGSAETHLRIVQMEDEVFCIQQKFVTHFKNGFLFPKAFFKSEWVFINVLGEKAVYCPKPNLLVTEAIVFKSHKEALKCITDTVKYPVYH